MPQRLVSIVIPAGGQQAAERILAENVLTDCWIEPMLNETIRIEVVVATRKVEQLTRELEVQFSQTPQFRVLIMALEASIPAVASTSPTVEPGTSGRPSRIERFFTRDRVSTDELYDDVLDAARLTPVFLVMIVLSALIAAVGLRSGLVAVVIGAMVIAPLLGPSVGLALAATINDRLLAIESLKSVLLGSALAIATTALVGLIVEINPMVHELNARTRFGPEDIVLATASGIAGTLFFSGGRMVSLVGVAIAVALMPPLAAAGMLFGAGYLELSAGAFFLFLTNLICINVAGIGTFLVQGLPPKDWRLTGMTLLVWMALLSVLVALILGRAFV